MIVISVSWFLLCLVLLGAEAGAGAETCACSQVAARQVLCNATTLTVVPPCVGSVTKGLAINGTSIPIRAETFSRFRLLETVGIWERRDLDYLPVDLFRGNPELQHVYVVNTNLSYVSPETFQFTPKLRHLGLSYNAIKVLSPDTFRFLPQLKTLAINDNALSTIGAHTFTNTKLKVLLMADNPWVCDCNMAQLLRWLKQKAVTISQRAACHNPPHLRGKLLTRGFPEWPLCKIKP